jgi:hypothetical protein
LLEIPGNVKPVKDWLQLVKADILGCPVCSAIMNNVYTNFKVIQLTEVRKD